MNLRDYKPVACLPFLGITTDHPVEFGPVLFWPADRILEIFDTDVGGRYLDYLEKLTITPQAATCVAIHPDVPENQYRQRHLYLPRPFLALKQLF